jgi:hypothetical protein
VIGNRYKGGVSFIGRYDESPITLSTQQDVLLPGNPAPYVFDILAGTTTSPNNTASLGQGVVDQTLNVRVSPNQHAKIVDNATVRWPSDLTSYTQIKSVTIRFYSAIGFGWGAGGSLLSDARVTFGIDGPMLFYQYWRIVNKDVNDNSIFPFAFANPFGYAFASTNASVGTTGAISPPLQWTELTLTSPSAIQAFFGNFGAGPRDIYLFIGYQYLEVLYNFSANFFSLTGPPVVSTLSLTYM